MRILFLVQGEGRGHLTQALAFAQLVGTAGHEVVGALVGITSARAVPAFFSEAFTAPIIPLLSPGLVYHAQTNALRPFRTTLKALLDVRTYFKSMRQVADTIEDLRPDVVVNFYELLGGLTYALYRPAVPMICVAHQYLAFHPCFPFPARSGLDQLLFKWNTWVTAVGAREILALSFDPQPDGPDSRLRVVPPLLRRELTERQPMAGRYVLAYTTQPGLVTQIRQAHESRPDVPLRCFHAGAKAPEEVIDDTLTDYAIDGPRFLDAMAHCGAVATTAGFEAVCEALYLGKPVLMIPQPNHFEQACNALDGQRVGAGIASPVFDLTRLVDYLPQYDPAVSERFQQWHARGYYLFLAALNRAHAPKGSNPMRSFRSRLGRLQRL